MQGNTDVAYCQAASEPVAYRLVILNVTNKSLTSIILFFYHSTDLSLFSQHKLSVPYTDHIFELGNINTSSLITDITYLLELNY